ISSLSAGVSSHRACAPPLPWRRWTPSGAMDAPRNRKDEDLVRRSGVVPAVGPVLAPGPAGVGGLAAGVAADAAVPAGGDHLHRAVRLAAGDPAAAGAAVRLAPGAGVSVKARAGSAGPRLPYF